MSSVSRLTFSAAQRFRAEGIATALSSRGYRRREHGLEPGDVRVVRDGTDVHVEWFPLVWDLEMLNRLRRCAGVAPTLCEIQAFPALRELSAQFPDRRLALEVLAALEVSISGVAAASRRASSCPHCQDDTTIVCPFCEPDSFDDPRAEQRRRCSASAGGEFGIVDGEGYALAALAPAPACGLCGDPGAPGDPLVVEGGRALHSECSARLEVAEVDR